MKQSEIRIGGTYVQGRGGGSAGIHSTGQRVRVVEKGIQRDRWKSVADGVRVQYLLEDGTVRLHPQNDYNDNAGTTGKPVERVLAARLILSLAEVERREEEARKAEEERLRRQELVQQTKAEVEDRIGTFFGISPVDIHVRVQWDFKLEEPVPQHVRMDDVLAFMAAMGELSNGKDES
jgi:hypothetical protein